MITKIVIMLTILVLMWRSDWIYSKFKRKRPHIELGEQANNFELFGPVDLSKTKKIFDDDPKS